MATIEMDKESPVEPVNLTGIGLVDFGEHFTIDTAKPITAVEAGVGDDEQGAVVTIRHRDQELRIGVANSAPFERDFSLRLAVVPLSTQISESLGEHQRFAFVYGAGEEAWTLVGFLDVVQGDRMVVRGWENSNRTNRVEYEIEPDKPAEMWVEVRDGGAWEMASVGTISQEMV